MPAADYTQDSRVVMTLDGGGTNFRFSAVRGGKPVIETVVLPAGADDLQNCLRRLVEGFRRIRQVCPEPPAAISFAFPGPADYPRGIIGDLGNLPCFRGGVALGPLLEDEFGVPVFINNDGDLFAYGEAMGGFLPHINGLLAGAGSPKRFSNLLGVTLGTGLGGGIVRHGELFLGDNSMAGEIWLLRNKLSPTMNAEEGASIRAVRRVYAECAGRPLPEAPEPAEIHQIALGQRPGDKAAAVEAFRRLGETVGDALGNALTLVDGLAVIGGGLAGAASLFLPALVEELNSEYVLPDGKRIRRLAAQAFNLEDPGQLAAFLKGGHREIAVPRVSPATGNPRTVPYDPLPRIGVGLSRLGTSHAVALGAYTLALQKLNRGAVSSGGATID
ncbi:MAG TPA: ROK family protein [Verrucomicrobiae bacterium]|nr:ROK family protein [Verrucomicrobiae bacterium]